MRITLKKMKELSYGKPHLQQSYQTVKLIIQLARIVESRYKPTHKGKKIVFSV